MKHLGFAMIHVAFYSCVGFACYWTKSAMPLWALLLSPSISMKDKDNE